MFEKLVLVTRRTRLEGLIERFNTRGQAKFYLQQAGLDFAEYEREHDVYARSLELTRGLLEKSGLKVQVLDRAGWKTAWRVSYRSQSRCRSRPAASMR